MVSATAVIVAGGKGERMNSDLRKQYLMLGDFPIISHALIVFDSCPLVNRIFLVIPKIDFDYCKKNILAPINIKPDVQLVSSGKERQESVYNGLSAITEKDGIVVIHDGVRPFVTAKQIEACIHGAEKEGACIMGISAVDTLKKVDSQSYIINTMQRSNIWQAQTPQAFQYHLIKKAHDLALSEGFTGTDDASLVERFGKRVKVIPGSPYNIKITNPEDLSIAHAILQHVI